MARKSSKTTKPTGEVAGKATNPPEGSPDPSGEKPEGPGAPGRDLSVEELGGMTAGATRIRIKVDFADLSGHDPE